MKKAQSNNINDYPDADLLFPGRYVKAAEVKQAGRPVPLTIARIEPRHELKSTSGKVETKPCLFFRETDKGIVLNKTNSKRLVEALGKDPRKWIGCRVVPAVEKVDGFGKKVEAIRFDVDATRDANRGRPVAAPEPPQEREPGWDDLEEPPVDEAELARQAREAEGQ